jgi:hypothetical protein
LAEQKNIVADVALLEYISNLTSDAIAIVYARLDVQAGTYHDSVSLVVVSKLRM